MVKTHGIMMSGEMIRAYKARLKTQTRRTRGLDTINQDPDQWEFRSFTDGVIPRVYFTNKIDKRLHFSCRCPYGGVGGTLWFKETYAHICREVDCSYHGAEREAERSEEEFEKNHYIEYRADTGNKYPGDWPEEEARGNDEAPKWKSSMFMKHDYARFKHIPIVKVRVERLQSIGARDCEDEGISLTMKLDPYDDDEWLVDQYKQLWDKLNGKKLPWSVNPWVWVYEFPKYNKENSSHD